MIKLTHIKVDKSKKIVRLEGISDKKINALLFSFQQIKEYKHPKVKMELPVIKNGEMFNVDLSLDHFFKKMIYNSSTTWDIEAISETGIHQIYADPDLLQSAGVNNILPLLNLTFDIKVTVQLKLNLISFKALVESLETIGTNSTIEGYLKTNVKLHDHHISLEARRRSNSALYNFHEESYEFPVQFAPTENKFQLNLNWDELPQFLCQDDLNVCDFVLKIANQYGHEVVIYLDLPEKFKKELVERQIKTSSGISFIKPYITGSRRLSFYVIRDNKQRVDLALFKQHDNYYQLKLILDPSIDNNQDNKLVLKRRDKKGMAFEYQNELVWNINKETDIEISFESFLCLPGVYHSGTWDFYLRTGEIDYYINVPDNLHLNSDYTYVQFNQYKAKVFKSPSKTLSWYTILSDKLNPKAINIGVMGTCFSRNMFNSSLYFNPGYKQVINCSFTQFHSSIISIMTNPFEFNLDKYTDMTASEKNFVREDFSKGFFEKLKESGSEYLLIDLYPDVIRPVIWLTNNSAVTLSYVIEDSELLNDLPVERIIDHIDNLAFFNEWKKYADLFIEKLTQVIPPERIILNKGRFTKKYYDKTRNKIDFPNQMMIDRNNYFWDKLDNYFYSKLPEAQLLDLRQKPYIGDINYPYGNSFSHYESIYYKDLFKELTQIILKEKINRSK